MTTVQNNIRTRPHKVAPGALLSVTPAVGFAALVEYTTAMDSAVANNTAAWAQWPKGIVGAATTDSATDALWVRVTGLGGAVVFTIDDNPMVSSLDPLQYDWVSQGKNTVGLASISSSGQVAVGQVLTAVGAVGTIPSGYQWYRDVGAGPVAISGATSTTYTRVSADVATPGGAPISITVAITSSQFMSMAAVSYPPAPVPNTSIILNQANIATMLTAIKSATTQRVALGWHGMSIDVGAGTVGPAATNYGETEFSTLGIVSKTASGINTARGGAFGRGVETVSSLSGSNPFFTLGGGAAVLAKQAAAGGTCGQGVSLVGGGTTTISFPVTSGFVGQVVKIYGYTTGGVGGIIPRYSLSGANTQATTGLPASTTANPVPNLSYYWYETSLTMVNAGTTTVTLLAPTAAGASFVFYMVDPDVKTSPGLTIHRLAQAGETLATLVGASWDNTDVAPTGGFWNVATGGANSPYFRSAQTDSMTLRPGIVGVIASGDINDVLTYGSASGSYGYGWTLADHSRHLTNYVTALAARGLQVLFVLGNLRSPDTPAMVGNPYTQTQVIDVYKAVAAASTNAAVLDLTTQFRGVDEATTFANQAADTTRWLASEGPRYVHPSAVGHAFYGAYVASQILAALP